MKILILIVLCILPSIVPAQTILIGSFAVGIPKNATKLDPNKFQQQATTLSVKYSQIPSRATDLYSVNDATLGFWVVNSGSDERTMGDRKSEFTEMFKLPSSYKLIDADISQPKGTSFLVLNYQIDGKYYFRFYSDYIKHTVLNGVLEYTKDNETKAKATLTEVLSGISVAN